MRKRPSIGNAFASGDTRAAFRIIRAESRRHASSFGRLYGLGPGHRAMVLGRTIEHFTATEPERHMRCILALAHEAIKTIDMRRLPAQGRIRANPAMRKRPRLP